LVNLPAAANEGDDAFVFVGDPLAVVVGVDAPPTTGGTNCDDGVDKGVVLLSSDDVEALFVTSLPLLVLLTAAILYNNANSTMRTAFRKCYKSMRGSQAQ
jgi:hypothetical protein